MLTKRIVPCLDVDGGRVVKGKKFKGIKDVGDPVELAARYSELGADELVFYDITASNDERNIFLDIVFQTADTINIPFMVGGGVRSVDDFSKLLKAGADKISVNSAAVKNPALITEAALKFGSQCVVLSIDLKETSPNKWQVFVKGGRENTGIDAVWWAKEGVRLGAGELVLNCIDTDGVKAGYACDIIREISEAVSVPVVASGGAGKKEDFEKVLSYGKADAALAASVFHYGTIPIPELKTYLAGQGIAVRRIKK